MILNRYSDFRAVFGAGNPTDASGYETWPVDSVIYAPETGFDLAQPSLAAVMNVTVNAEAADAVPGVDKFDWYFHQRTDDPTRQLFAAIKVDTAPLVETFSGTIALFPTALMTSLYGYSSEISAISADDMVPIFRDVCIYVRRRSNGHIMRARLS